MKGCFWRAALGLTASVLFATCSWAAETPLKIGFHGVLTGPNSVDGVNGQISMNLALDKWNKAGGINGHPIEMVYYDDQAKPELAVPIANRLVGDDKVMAVLSATLSEPTKAAAPFVNEAGIPYVSAWASSPDVTALGNFVFRIGLLGQIEGQAGAMVVHDILKKNNVAMLTVKADLGRQVSQGFHENAAKLHLDVVKEIEYAVGDRQFGPVIANLKSLNPEAIFLVGYYFNGTVVPQLRSAGLTMPIVGMTSFSAQQFLDIAGPAANGMLVLNAIDWSNPSPDLKAFLEAFKAKAGYAPTASAAHSYVAADVLFQAIRNSPHMTSAEIRDNLATGHFETIVGPLSFNSRREAKRVVYVSEIENGAYSTKAILDDPVLLAPPEK